MVQLLLDKVANVNGQGGLYSGAPALSNPSTADDDRHRLSLVLGLRMKRLAS